MRQYYENHYKPLLLTAPNPNGGDDCDNDGGSSSCDKENDSDDSSDPDYVFGVSQLQYYSTRRGTEMAIAMDKLNALMMSLQGTSPEDAAKRWEKRMEEEEQVAQQASRNKVMEWLGVQVGGS